MDERVQSNINLALVLNIAIKNQIKVAIQQRTQVIQEQQQVVLIVIAKWVYNINPQRI